MRDRQNLPIQDDLIICAYVTTSFGHSAGSWLRVTGHGEAFDTVHPDLVKGMNGAQDRPVEPGVWHSLVNDNHVQLYITLYREETQEVSVVSPTCPENAAQGRGGANAFLV